MVAEARAIGINWSFTPVLDINAFATAETMQQAVVNLLLGDAPFTDTTPVDAFCGLPDARY